jgi:signal transduction histidine kinase
MSLPSSNESENIAFSHDQFVFLRTMGHELRTPLNSIVATGEMMVNAIYGELQPGQKKAAERMMRNGNRLVNLINAVMLYIRAQANALELSSLSVQLKELLNEHVVGCRERATAKGLILVIDIHQDVVETISADPDQIAFVLNEVLRNAITFTPSGKIEVCVRNVDPAHWMLSISDTGIGIDQENLSHIYTPFWRGPSAKQFDQEGNGLGLPIVREFIRLMNGEIDIKSEIGKGTVVTITLPNSIPATNIPAQAT